MKNSTDWEGYLNRFSEILSQETPEPPYNDDAYFDYLKLNNSRLNRWLKVGKLNEELKKIVQKIDKKQTWYVITEPWCGDAAHNVPFIKMIAAQNPLIGFKIIFRDTAPFMIDDYLTNGGKSIPKLVIRDENENDLFTWGPRPVECQKIYEKLKADNIDFDGIKIALQKWYNDDKGKSIQLELAELLS